MNGLHKFQDRERDEEGKKNGLRGLNTIGPPIC
jgi:hypothetical protein